MIFELGKYLWSYLVGRATSPVPHLGAKAQKRERMNMLSGNVELKEFRSPRAQGRVDG